MTRTMTTSEFAASAISILDEVAAGEHIIVEKQGRPFIRVVPIRNLEDLEGMFSGKVSSVDRDDDLFSTNESWNASHDLPSS